MFYPPAINLFLYNILLSHVLKHVSRSVDGHDHGSFWGYLPILGDYMTKRKSSMETYQNFNEFPEAMLNFNYVINTLALLPGFVQNRVLNLMVAVIIIWNVFVFERLFAFQLTLMWSLWRVNISAWDYATIIGLISLMNIFHLMLIADSLRMQHRCLRSTMEAEHQEDINEEEQVMEVQRVEDIQEEQEEEEEVDQVERDQEVQEVQEVDEVHEAREAAEAEYAQDEVADEDKEQQLQLPHMLDGRGDEP